MLTVIELEIGFFVRAARGMVLMIAIVNGAIACSTGEHPAASRLEAIEVTDAGSIAGTWEGLLEQSASRRDDWVRLKIQQDGTYHFEAVRTIGVFSGNGKLGVENGKFIARSERGEVNLQLYRQTDKDGRVLKAEGKGRDGITYRAELTPTRAHR